MVRFDPTKKEITLDEIKEITIPLFKKYGFKSAYLYGYYTENTEIQDIDMEFIVEHTEKTELMTMGAWYDLIDEFEEHLHIPCQILDTQMLETDNYDLQCEFNKTAILIYEDK